MDVASRQGAVCGITNDGGANLLVCLNLTASKRSNADGTMGLRTQEHRKRQPGCM